MSQSENGTASSGPPVTADPQDPLPESNWFYRRMMVFVGDAVRAAALGWILWCLYLASRDGSAPSIVFLYKIAVWLLILSLVDRVLYLIAPSAEQATKMLATVAAWRSGVSTSVRARVSGPSGEAQTETTAGPAVAPPPSPVTAPPLAGPGNPALPNPPGGAGPVPPTVDLSQE